jgi:hypothetical protein
MIGPAEGPASVQGQVRGGWAHDVQDIFCLCLWCVVLQSNTLTDPRSMWS